MKHSRPSRSTAVLALALVGACGKTAAPLSHDEPGSGGRETSPGGAGGSRPGSGGRGGAGGIAQAGGRPGEPADAASSDRATSAEPDAAPAIVDAKEPPQPPGDVAFKHPGALVNKAQLDFVREKVKAGAQPWKGAYDKAVGRAGSLGYKAQPRAVVECGAYSNPNNGCSEERNDAVAAYTHALAWYVTRNEAHAKKAIEIMAAWAHVLKSHTAHNAPLQTGWAGAIWPLAGEIVRHTYPGWPAAERDAFAAMLRDVYLASTIVGSSTTNGNWELVMIEAAIEIAVFLDDRASFDRAVEMARKRLPAYMYIKADGAAPAPPPGGTKDTPEALSAYWYGMTMFVDGLAQETCRDFGHTQYGIASSLAIAETAFQQGVDLYKEHGERLRAAMEFHADFILGKAAPAWLCGGKLNTSVLPTWEIGFNHFHDRLGMALPLTQKLIESRVRSSSGVDHHIVWETLTHAGVGWAGLR